MAKKWRVQTGGFQPASRRFWFSYETVIVGSETKRGSIRVWLPAPGISPCQEILEESFSGAEFVETREKGYGNRVFFAEFPVSIEERRLTQKYLIRRQEVRPLIPPSLKASPASVEMERYLKPTMNVPVEGEVVADAPGIAAAGEPPFEICRKTFNHFLSKYEYDQGGCTLERASELGDLHKMCSSSVGTCTDWHGLFVSWMRFFKIPSGFHFGFNIPGERQSGEISGYHCWADVYLPAVAWFPVDITEAKKRPEEKERFFGGLDENRIEFTKGRDLLLDPQPAIGLLDKLIFPHVEANNGPHPFNVRFSFEEG